ncbi:hypothetical protein [Thalassobacillus devorans]|uniref:hypothetical protein n=1 Tax=Thalassobacillus devorans TaxID=279813 RepID=UPI00048B8228|nr:hypothetical protein [Thalassobacillus devorans]
MRTTSTHITDTSCAVVFNASEQQEILTVDKRKYELQPAEWAEMKESMQLEDSSISASTDNFYCIFDYDGKLKLGSYPLMRPQKQEASLLIIHSGTGILTPKARYGDAFPPLSPGNATTPINLFVPMDVVIDFYEQTESPPPRATYHYVTAADQAGILLYTNRSVHFIEIFSSL